MAIFASRRGGQERAVSSGNPSICRPAPLDCLQMPEQIDWEGQKAQIDAAMAAGAAMLRCRCRFRCCCRCCCRCAAGPPPLPPVTAAVHRCLRTLFRIAVDAALPSPAAMPTTRSLQA